MSDAILMPGLPAAAEPDWAEYQPSSAPNLQITPFNSQSAQPQYVIQGPDDDFIRTNETGVRLLGLLDGASAPAALQREFARRYGQQVGLEKVKSFLDLCASHGLLEAGSWPGVRAAAPAAGERGQHRLRFHRQLIGGQRLVEGLVSRRRWWFNPLTIGLALAVMAFGLVWLAISPGPISFTAPVDQLRRGGSYGLLAAIILLLSLEISLHEIAHAVACRLVGAKSGGFGIGLLWLVLPVFYTDTRDVYTVDSKYKRAAVSLAGPLMDLLLLGVISLIIWRVPDTTPLGRFALAYHPIPLSLLLLNLNPFLVRMDGYWIVIDLLEQPNLRRLTLQLAVSKLLGRFKPGLVPPGAAQWTGDKRLRTLCLIYGALTLIWTVGFIGTFVLSLTRGMLTLLGSLF